MVFKKLLTAASAVALITAPTVAVAQSSASAPAAMEPAGESVEGSELRGRRGGGWFIPIIVVIVIILAIIIIVQDDDDDGQPVTPG